MNKTMVNRMRKAAAGYDKGKVEVLDLIQQKGMWSITFKEKGKVHTIENKDRELIESIFIYFGGKNLFTAKADPKFLILSKEWDARHVEDLGHRIKSVTIQGDTTIKYRRHEVAIPTGCGNRPNNSDKTGDVLYNKESHRETVSVTRFFSTTKEFNTFARFLTSHENLKELNMKITRLITVNKKTKDECVWRKISTGDGSKNNSLELESVGGKLYSDLPRNHVVRAAGDMLFAECERVKVMVDNSYRRNMCLIGVEEKNVDISKYKVS